MATRSVKKPTEEMPTSQPLFEKSQTSSPKGKQTPPRRLTAKEKRSEERANAGHTLVLEVLTTLKKYANIILGSTIIFLLLFIFVIMPISVMDLSGETIFTILQNYSIALRETLGGFGATILAIIVVEILKLFGKIIKKNF
ncbi:MAG: hypothetical protein FWG65_12855 [Turicibacter sp.]|nr:hypothetical protein [Turicibacter sp.]